MVNKKVLHVVSSMNPILGGVSKAVETIAESLITSGVYNDVVSLDNPEADFIKQKAYNIYALGEAPNPWSYHKGLLPWLKENLQRYHYVVIHGLWQYNAYAVHTAMRFLKTKNKKTNLTKYYVMPHGMLDPYFQQAKKRRLKAIRNNIYWKFIEQRVVNEADGLLFTCEEEKLLARLPFKPFQPKQEYVVGLGIEAPPVLKVKMDDAFFKVCETVKNRPYILFISRIHEKKGVDLLIEAYDNLISRSTSLEQNLPALVIAGPGIDTDYGKSILNKVKQSKILKERIFFPGMLSGDTKWGAFFNCEAFVLPSHQENFGIAVVEALACGKPVLISNKINIWKEINDAQAGIVVNDTLSGTTQLLEKWLGLSRTEKSTLGKNALACFLNHFSIESVVNNWKNKVLINS